MATYEVSEYDIDINSKHFINAISGGYGIDDQDKPRLYFDESVVWALNCFKRDLTAASFAESDTWELWADIDFDHDLFDGTLNAALTTAAATTSVVINYAEAPTANAIGSTGALLLRDDDGNRERVAYTAVTGAETTQATYTTNVTLTYPYATGDYAANEDPLMVGSDDDDFNVSGDWSELSVAGGKISAKVNCTAWEFQKKVQAYYVSNPSANEVPIWVQINKYVSGQSTPSVILQDTIYAKPTVRDLESAAAVNTSNWTLADARYLKVYNLYSTTTEAIANDDMLNFYNASASGIQKKTVAEFRHDVENAQTTTSYTLLLTDDGKTVSMTNSSANQLTIPSTTSVAFVTGTVVMATREGTGATTIAAATTDVTLNGTAGGQGLIDSQYDGVALIKRGSNDWMAMGAYTEVTT